VLIVPSIQTVLERKARMTDSFRRAVLIVPSIQAVLERKARMTDSFR
jgi:hypothetical protein